MSDRIHEETLEEQADRIRDALFPAEPDRHPLEVYRTSELPD